MRDPNQTEDLDPERFDTVLFANPFNGEDLELFRKQAGDLLRKEKFERGVGTHKGSQVERDARQALWTLHMAPKRIRGFVAGALLGAGVGATALDNNMDPILRMVVPAGIMATVVRLTDMVQFKLRAQKAVPEFWDLPRD